MNRIIKLIITAYVIAVLMLGCKLGEQLNYNHPKTNNDLHFLSSLRYNNRKASHRPIGVFITVFDRKDDNSAFHYYLYFEENKLEKFENVRRKYRKKYILTQIIESEMKLSDLKLNHMDSAVMDRMQYFLDSLKLPNAKILTTGNAFRVVEQ